MIYDEEDIGGLVESRTRAMWYGRSELVSRGLEDVSQLDADPELLRQVEILKNPEHWMKRLRAWDRIREMGPSVRGWTSALRDLIFNADGWGRIFAAESLAWHRCCEAEAVPVLLVTLRSTLENRFYDWSRMACGAIGRYDPLPKPLIDQSLPAMMAALNASDPNVRGYAAQALGNWGEHSRPALVRLADLHDGSEAPLKEHYLAMIRKIDPGISTPQEARVQALYDADAAVRTDAVASLGRVGPPAADALPHLLPLAGDGSAEVRRNLALALGDLQISDDEVVRRLSALGEDRQWPVRLAAAYAFVRLEINAGANLSVLRRGLDAGSESARYLAAWALGEIGGRSAWRSGAALRKQLRKEQAEPVRTAILRALEKLSRKGS